MSIFKKSYSRFNDKSMTKIVTPAHLYSVIHYPHVTSTMEVAKNHLTDRTIVYSDTQSHGRGRFHRPWVSPQGNIYATLIMEESKCPLPSHILPFAVAIALYQVLCHAPPPPHLMIKWPNDVLVDKKKIAGILIEKHNEFFLIGVGVNLISAPDIQDKNTTALSQWTDNVLSPKEALMRWIEAWESLQHLQTFEILTQWEARAHPKGCALKVSTHTQNFTGTYEGITPQGLLMLKVSNGEIFTFSAGDVSLTPL